MRGMRNHQQIIADASSDQLQAAVGLTVSVHTIRSWGARDSIPAPYWLGLTAQGLTTFEELAAGAAKRLERGEGLAA
jgi:hypothetical protein